MTWLPHPERVRFRSFHPLTLTCAVALLVTAAAALAAESTATTALEAGPWLRADAVVSARVSEVTDVRAAGGALGRQVVRARVLQAFKGPVRDGEDITVLVRGQRPTLDPNRPSVPYFRKGAAVRTVLFLARAHGESTFHLQTLYDAEEAVGAEKIAAVAALASWAAQPPGEGKARATLAGLMAMLKGRGLWLPSHAARELAFLAEGWPQVFDRHSVSVIQRLTAVAGDADRRFWLRRTVQVLEQARASGPRRARSAGDPWRDAFEAAPSPEDRRILLGRLLQTDDATFQKHAWWAWVRLEPSGRTWFVDGLVLHGRGAASARLRDLYGPEEDEAVRQALVRGVGLLGGGADVPWLVARAGNPALRRTALIALARVRTPDALAALRRAEADAEGDEARWIAYLRSPAFVATIQGEGDR